MNTSIPAQLKSVLILIAVFSFAISYNNLHEMAIQMGIPHYLAWFFPLCIDLFLIACSIFILYAEEKCPGESREGWIFLISYTVLSIWYNVLHSPPEFWYQVGFAICPVSLCVSLHLFIKVVKHEMGSVKVDVKNEEMPPDFTVPQVTMSEEDFEENTITEQPTLTSNQQKVLDVFKEDTKMSMAEACRRTGLSFKTVKGHKNTLEEMGMV